MSRKSSTTELPPLRVLPHQALGGHPVGPSTSNLTPGSIPSLPEGKHYHAFLTHDWGEDEKGEDNHEYVQRINEALKARGVITWFDGDRMQGNIVDQMTRGIDESACVVVFVTKNYETKVCGEAPGGVDDNCKMEFEYAHNHLGSRMLIPVVMEARMSNPKAWRGALGMSLGRMLYKANFGRFSKTNETRFEEEVKHLVDELADRKILAVTPSSAATPGLEKFEVPVHKSSIFSRRKVLLVAVLMAILAAAAAGLALMFASSSGGSGGQAQPAIESTSQVLSGVSFAGLDIYMLDDYLFARGFRSNFTDAMAAAAGTSYNAVDIVYISSGSVVVASRVTLEADFVSAFSNMLVESPDAIFADTSLKQYGPITARMLEDFPPANPSPPVPPSITPPMPPPLPPLYAPYLSSPPPLPQPPVPLVPPPSPPSPPTPPPTACIALGTCSPPPPSLPPAHPPPSLPPPRPPWPPRPYAPSRPYPPRSPPPPSPYPPPPSPPPPPMPPPAHCLVTGDCSPPPPSPPLHPPSPSPPLPSPPPPSPSPPPLPPPPTVAPTTSSPTSSSPTISCWAGTRGSIYFPTLVSRTDPAGVDIGELGLQGESFTVSVWVRPALGAMTAWSGTLDILGPANPSCGTRSCLHIRHEGGKMKFGFYGDDLDAERVVEGDDDATYSANSEEEQWHHWAFTYDASSNSRCVIRDGGARVCDVSGGSLRADFHMRIGATNLRSQGAYAFMGHMANFAVWKEALSTETLQTYSSCQWEATLPPQATLVFLSSTASASNMAFVGGETFDSSEFPKCCNDGWYLWNSTTCYRFYATPSNWNEAHTACRELGANLASVHSQEENAMIVRLVNTTGEEMFNTWLGGRDYVEGEWAWSDLTPFDWSLGWNPAGGPDNWGGDEDCLILRQSPNTYWADDWCGMRTGPRGGSGLPLGYVCKVNAFPDVFLPPSTSLISISSAYLSSTYEDNRCAAENCIDGDITGANDCDAGRDSYTTTCHSDEGSDPYLRLDVGGVVVVTSVLLYPRDGGRYRLGTHEIWVGDEASDAGSNTLCNSLLSDADFPVCQTCVDLVKHNCSNAQGVIGRYIFVRLPGNPRILDLTEVQIVGYSTDLLCDHRDYQCLTNWSFFQHNGAWACYQAFFDSKNWTSARADCVALGGDLASIHNTEENMFVANLLMTAQGSVLGWIGGTDESTEGTWIWSDGSPWSFSSWEASNPNNGDRWTGAQNYLMTNFKGVLGQWDDNNPRDLPAYVCKKLF